MHFETSIWYDLRLISHYKPHESVMIHNFDLFLAPSLDYIHHLTLICQMPGYFWLLHSWNPYLGNWVTLNFWWQPICVVPFKRILGTACLLTMASKGTGWGGGIGRGVSGATNAPVHGGEALGSIEPKINFLSMLLKSSYTNRFVLYQKREIIQ